jgi:CheY-like chemotaxis protein
MERPMKLLLVEDHEATLEALTVLLQKAGHEVTAVGNLAGARAAAAARAYDGLISDVGLPDGTGFELMEELSGKYGLRGIVLSGYGMEEDLRRSREVGFVAHLVKPVRIGDLRQTLLKLEKPGTLPGA